MSWLMRTAIKAKAGSQGILFQGGANQMTAAKWPRRYTPERLNQVRAHLVPEPLALSDEPRGLGLEHRNLVDTVARSTVPESHLLGIQWAPGTPPSAMHTKETLGQYNRLPESPLISIRAGQATGDTVIHEIGHHVSQLQGPVPYESQEERGREEGLADNYAQEHFRDRRGRPVRVPTYADGLQSANVSTSSAEWFQDRVRDRNQAFYDSYHAVRGTDPDPTGTVIDAEIQHKYDNPTLPGLERYHAGYEPNLLGGASR